MIENELLKGVVSSEQVEPLFPERLTGQTDRQFVISVIAPTRNKAGNIEPLLRRIDQATTRISTEVVFVDDALAMLQILSEFFKISSRFKLLCKWRIL